MTSVIVPKDPPVVEHIEDLDVLINTPLRVSDLEVKQPLVYRSQDPNNLCGNQDETITVEPYLRRIMAERLQAMSEEIYMHDAASWVYDQLRARGSLSLKSLYGSRRIPQKYMDKAVLWLLNSKIVTTEICDTGSLTLVLGAESPPIANENDLELYVVDVGVTYWIVEQPFDKDDPKLLQAIVERILEVEVGVAAEGDLEGMLKQFSDIYGYDYENWDTGISLKDIRVMDREEGIHTACRLDDGRGTLTMWTVYCEQTEPTLLACSEW